MSPFGRIKVGGIDKTAHICLGNPYTKAGN